MIYFYIFHIYGPKSVESVGDRQTGVADRHIQEEEKILIQNGKYVVVMHHY